MGCLLKSLVHIFLVVAVIVCDWIIAWCSLRTFNAVASIVLFTSPLNWKNEENEWKKMNELNRQRETGRKTNYIVSSYGANDIVHNAEHKINRSRWTDKKNSKIRNEKKTVKIIWWRKILSIFLIVNVQLLFLFPRSTSIRCTRFCNLVIRKYVQKGEKSEVESISRITISESDG